MRGAGSTIDSVMPVRIVIIGGIGTPGFTSVSNRPSNSPPRSLSAPSSVIASALAEPPVVSRSSTTNVVSESGVPRSASDCWRRRPNAAGGVGSNPGSTAVDGEVGATGRGA